MSWPQACMTPGTWDWRRFPAHSCTGRASMSARMATRFPGPFPRMRATSPVSTGRGSSSKGGWESSARSRRVVSTS